MIMWGAIDELFWGVLLGIRGPDYYGPRPLAPGFAQVEIRPQVVGDLTAAAGALKTVHGRVAVEWRREPEQFILEVSLPPGVRGKVSVPTLGLTSFRIEEHSSLVWQQDAAAAAPGPWPVTGIAAAAAEAAAVAFEVGSGDYRFVLRSGTG
jgi:alpha-L-rhamnosidase